jgi:hypothetical protein
MIEIRPISATAPSLARVPLTEPAVRDAVLLVERWFPKGDLHPGTFCIDEASDALMVQVPYHPKGEGATQFLVVVSGWPVILEECGYARYRFVFVAPNLRGRLSDIRGFVYGALESGGDWRGIPIHAPKFLKGVDAL